MYFNILYTAVALKVVLGFIKNIWKRQVKTSVWNSYCSVLRKCTALYSKPFIDHQCLHLLIVWWIYKFISLIFSGIVVNLEKHREIRTITEKRLSVNGNSLRYCDFSHGGTTVNIFYKIVIWKKEGSWSPVIFLSHLVHNWGHLEKDHSNLQDFHCSFCLLQKFSLSKFKRSLPSNGL